MADRGNSARTSVIQADMAVIGDIRQANEIEVLGTVDGSLSANLVRVAEGGRVHGETRAESLDVAGEVQGDVHVRGLTRLHATGHLAGDLRYSQIEVMTGGTLSADLRNVPPELFGDKRMVVGRGGRALVTPQDIAAVDPDDSQSALTFVVSAPQRCALHRNGGDRFEAVSEFTAADVVARRIYVVHDGSDAREASFDVLVRDDDGATSGAPETVTVAVRAS